METKTKYQELYTGLGYLFYSIAASDGHVRPAESEKLKELITKQWLPMEDSRDEFGTDAGNYIGISFDYANDQELSANDAFDRFKEEYRAALDLFDPAIKRAALDTAVAIANSFAGKNKSELVRLSQLELLFKS